jgi:uncharacterized membrane protein
MKSGKNPENSEGLSTQDQTSANIGLSLSTTELETAPGGSVEIIIKIRNLSTIVDRFHIKVSGLDPTWWTLSIPTFACFPRDQGESKLTIHPPKEAEAMAGSYSFRVKAVSEANPQEETVVAAMLVLHGFIIWEVELSPTKVVGYSGTYRIIASNSGNTDAVLLLEGKDPEESLIFNFSQDKVTVPAGETTQVKLTIYPKKGEERKTHYFQVISKQVGASKEVKVLSGQLEYLPRRKFPWWLVPAALGVIGIVLILLGIGAGVYQSTTLYFFTSTPYQSYMLPLIIVGAILIIVGAVIGLRKNKKNR